MLRVLLVLEDYGELMFLQTVLKKIGFDVDSTQNPRKFSDSLLSMNPDILVMTASGKRIKGTELLPQVRRVRGLPKIILIKSNALSTKETLDSLEVEGWLDSPVGAPDLLSKIAELANLNNQVLQDKLLKMRMQDGVPEEARVLKVNAEDADPASMQKAEKSSGNFGVMKASTMSSSDRQSRFKKFLDADKPEKHGFALKAVQEQIKELRKEENPAALEDLERERRAFVEHLFKNKKAG